jgi:hypothetical protein
MLWPDMRTSEIITRSVSVTSYSRYSVNCRKHVITWFIVFTYNFSDSHISHNTGGMSSCSTWSHLDCLPNVCLCSQIFLSHNSQLYTRPSHSNCVLLTVSPQDLVLLSPSAGYWQHVTRTVCTFYCHSTQYCPHNYTRQWQNAVLCNSHIFTSV